MTIVLKIFRNQTGNRYGIILGNYLTCVITAFLFIPDKSSIPGTDMTTLICSVAAGFLFVAALITMQSSIRANGAILTSAFSKMGLVIPLVISIAFLGEKIRVLQIPGIILIFLSFWLISTDKRSSADRTSDSFQINPLLLFAVLATYGLGDSMAKIFDHFGKAENSSVYFFFLFTVAAVLTLLLVFAEYKKTGRKIILKEFLAGVFVGIPNYFSSVLLLKALNGLPSFVVYPCFSAGTLLLVTVLGALVFKEKPGRKAWAGLFLIIAALVFLNIN